jgi:hypothetical protein
VNYLPTIYLTDGDLYRPEVAAALKPGQWFELTTGLKGRWVGLTPHGTVWAYWPNTHRGTFAAMRRAFVARWGTR